MGYYTSSTDKKSGDGLAITEWNDLSNAVAGNSGLTLAREQEDKVGIGTINPEAKLSINGGLHVGGDSDPGDNNLLVDGKVGVGREPDQALHVAVDKSVRFELGTAQKLSLGGNGSFEIDAPGTRGGRFIVEEGGNVGIGTDKPSAKLEVGGAVKATRFIGDGSQLTNLSVEAKVGIGLPSPDAPLSIGAAEGKEGGPDSAMHITNDCILFGGTNSGKEANSAQISAGKHIANSLNIVGMSSNTSASTRKIDAWAEGGFSIHGTLTVSGSLTVGNVNIGESLVPTGAILMWSGKANQIPTKWALCDGQNSTPDLRDRFIVATNDANKDKPSERLGSRRVAAIAGMVTAPYDIPTYALCFIMKL